MDITGTDEIQSDNTDVLDLWYYMTKLQNYKAKCNICNRILSRKNGATSGLRKHLSRVHKIELFGIASESPRNKAYQMSFEEKKKIDALVIKCIIQDGRSFDDMRRSGMLKVFKYLAPGKKNIKHFVTFI